MDSMHTTWQNRALEVCQHQLGDEEYNRRMKKTQVSDGLFSWSKPFLSLESNQAKKLVNHSSNNILRRCHGVGAIGYGVVNNNAKIPTNNFFVPGRRFRLRFRHSNVNCDDDAGSCQREAAIKFADRNEDGPLDLILFTGRTALARNCKTLLKVLKLTKPDHVRKLCFQDPLFFYSLVDGLRKAPASFANLTYYSQLPYQFISKENESHVARFRLIPGMDVTIETGLLEDQDQSCPWETMRKPTEERDPYYLRNEFIERLRKDEPIRYRLQIQLLPNNDQSMWNPQKIYDDSDKYPWVDLMQIELTTFIPFNALRRTFYNIVEKPSCLQFPAPSSATDPLSYQKVWSTIYTEYELRHKLQISDDGGILEDKNFVHHEVNVYPKALKDGRIPSVDIYITLAGTQSRTTPQQLLRRVETTPSNNGVDRYEIDVEDVGQLLAIIVAVKYRQLTDDWYLRYITITDAHDSNAIHQFLCHRVVFSKITLRNGQASLPQKESYEFHRQERLLALSENRIEYAWFIHHSLPSQIKAMTVQNLPAQDKQRANKYSGMLWQVDPELIEFFRALRHSMTTTTEANNFSSTIRPRSSGMNRQTSLSSSHSGALASESRRRTAMIRQLSLEVTPLYNNEVDESNKALSRWKKVKQVVKMISESKIPDGSKGEMCREVQNDVDFGGIFISGMNPTLIRRCNVIPEFFPVTDDMVNGLLDRKKKLALEAQDGYVYLVDYSLLNDISTIHRDADHRYIAAPVVLLYVRPSKELVPLAIQLKKMPSPQNPIWTPNDRPENWLLAKLWVRSVDFQWAFAISHLFRCHWLMEPFVIATMRQLSSAHPVYKMLKPYFRYTLATNTLLRCNVYKKGGLLDRYSSLGMEGFEILTLRYWSKFSFEELDPIKDFQLRQVDDERKLPNYLYRDDSIRLWNCLNKYVQDMLYIYYRTSEDVVNDWEIQYWIHELHENGFPNMSEIQSRGLPKSFLNLIEVADVVTKVIFTLTCQHSATHLDAVDFHGFVPDIPAMMRLPPPDSRNYVVNRETLTKILPDQYPDAYYGSLAFIMQMYKPDENVLGDCDEGYIAEDEAMEILKTFRQTLHQITTMNRARNIIAGFQYENLIPSYIPPSAEPLPFIPRDILRRALHGLGTGMCRDIFFRDLESNPAIPLMTLPLCRQFARNLGGRSTISRRLTMNILRDGKKSKEDSNEDYVFDGATGRQPMRGIRQSSSNF